MKRIIFIAVLLVPYLSYGNSINTYKVAGDSMYPMLISGDKVVISPNESIKRNCLVAIRFKHSSIPLVKRAMAVAGDRVEIKDNAIFINEVRQRKFDSQRWKSTVNQLSHCKWIIPQGHCFMLGDNPVNSRDSRRLGIISYDQIEGKVVEIIKPMSSQ